jgi:hypothetical protein
MNKILSKIKKWVRKWTQKNRREVFTLAAEHMSQIFWNDKRFAYER